MKKKLMMLFVAVVLSVTSIYAVDITASAEDIGTEVDIDTIMTEDALTGYTQSQTWGVYLLNGSSVINDAGGGKIGAGGITTAASRCKVTVNVIVERKVNGSWARVTSWSASKTDALSISSSKLISVASGYYYRVRCTHYASTDASGSYTGALWM